jgi:site-specific recombinase XerD
MNKSFSLIFYLKKRTNYVSGPIPIYARITVEGLRAELSVYRQCNPEKWNQHSGRMIGNGEEAKEMNAFLTNYQLKVFEAHREILVSNLPVTIEAIKNKLTGETERPRMLIEIFEHHNLQFAELVGKEYSLGTLKKFKTCTSSLKEFLKWKFKSCDVNIKTVGNEFINDYEFYLKSIQKIQHNTAMGYLKKLKKIIRQCVANDWLNKDPFMNYKIKIRETHRLFLSEEEINTISKKEFATTRLDQVRDIFLFSCFTGLSYSDIVKLKPSDISIGIDGQKWIFTTRTKTDTASRIPLLSIPLEIIDKYSKNQNVIYSGKLLPMLSNQRMNSYLKEISDLCNISNELTFHCARHTFATTVTLTNGVPIETVSKMLGHKNLRTTQHYAKILDTKVSDDMQLLRARYANGIEATIKLKKENTGT